MSLTTVVPVFNVLRLRKGPQDLPADPAVLVFWMGASVISGILVAGPLYGAWISVFLSVLDLALLYLFVLLLLGMRGLTWRWLQTYTAMVGVSAVLGIGMAILLWVFPPDYVGREVSGVGLVAHLMVLIWLLTAFGHILHQSLRLSGRVAGISIALGFLMLSSFVTQFAISLMQG
jgi:hypothetical protein